MVTDDSNYLKRVGMSGYFKQVQNLHYGAMEHIPNINSTQTGSMSRVWSSVELKQVTTQQSATVSCDIAPPPRRNNLPFVTACESKETFLPLLPWAPHKPTSRSSRVNQALGLVLTSCNFCSKTVQSSPLPRTFALHWKWHFGMLKKTKI